jgi:hypothetical protein
MSDLSPQRQALAAAIERLSEANAASHKVRSARSRAWGLVGQAQDAVEAAEQGLKDAKDLEIRQAMQRALGEITPRSSPSVGAVSSLADATQRLSIARQAADALANADDRAVITANAARGALTNAIGAVVRDEVLGEVFAQFDQALDHVANLRSILGLLPGLSQRDMDHSAVVVTPGSGKGLAQWRVALAGLESDATTPLPSVTDELGADAAEEAA